MEFIYDDGGRSKYFKANNVGDCAVRAIAIAMNKDYKEVYNDLKKLNKGQSCRNGTPKKVDRKYILSQGWIWYGVNRGAGESCRLTKEDLPKGRTLIVAVSKHLTCVKDGVIFDTFDCSRDGERTVYGYYYNPKELPNSLTHKIKELKKRRFVL